MDPHLVVNMRYSGGSIYFDFSRPAGHFEFLGEAVFDGLSYRVKQTVLYQPVDVKDVEKPFEIFVVEIENNQKVGHMIHVHRFEFLQPEPKSVHLVDHAQASLELEEFLDCPIDITKLEQLKGTFAIRTGNDTRFYMFIDDFYYKTGYNLIKMNYFLVQIIEWRRNAKKVKFDDDLPFNKRPKEEKISEVFFQSILNLSLDTLKANASFFFAALKYVKYLYGQFYLTYNREQTHRLEFENYNKKSEVLRAKETTGLQLHLCEHQIFIVKNLTFCFERQMYWFFSENGGKTTVKGETLAIHGIFYGSDISYTVYQG